MSRQSLSRTVARQIERTGAHLTSKARSSATQLEQSVRRGVIEGGVHVLRTVGELTEPMTRAGLAPDVAEQVGRQLKESVHKAIPSYDHLNVREVDARVRLLESVETLALVVAYEREHKNRVSVERSVTRQLKRLQPTVHRAPAWLQSVTR